MLYGHIYICSFFISVDGKTASGTAMALRDNFAVQTDDASMIAKLHRINGLELIDQAKASGNHSARLSANTAVKHANNALIAFHEAIRLLPDMTAAIKVKRSGDITLLESGSALNVARENLEIVAAIGIRLQYVTEGLQVALGMLLPPASRGILESEGGERKEPNL